MGRPYLGAGELRRLVAAENIVKGYQARAAVENWAEWAKDNPALSALLSEAMKLAVNDGE